jgi:hypothetical protein
MLPEGMTDHITHRAENCARLQGLFVYSGVIDGNLIEDPRRADNPWKDLVMCMKACGCPSTITLTAAYDNNALDERPTTKTISEWRRNGLRDDRTINEIAEQWRCRAEQNLGLCNLTLTRWSLRSGSRQSDDEIFYVDGIDVLSTLRFGAWFGDQLLRPLALRTLASLGIERAQIDQFIADHRRVMEYLWGRWPNLLDMDFSDP